MSYYVIEYKTNRVIIWYLQTLSRFNLIPCLYKKYRIYFKKIRTCGIYRHPPNPRPSANTKICRRQEERKHSSLHFLLAD